MNQKKTNPNDIRVQKTKKAIFKAFDELIQQRCVDKISVTELAKRAEINKGTFYLHYPDIYVLYEEALKKHIDEIVDDFEYFDYFLKDPDFFAKQYVESSRERRKRIKYDPYLASDNTQWSTSAITYLGEALSRVALIKANIPDTDENRLKLQFIFVGTSGMMHYQEEQLKKAQINVLSKTIKQLFLQN